MTQVPPGGTRVLDDGFVNLEFFAPEDADLWVVNCAKVSFGARADELGETELKILNFLARDHHTSPFEHNVFCFHIRAPIGVMREWQRHRIGWSYNEFSTRYAKVTEPAAYMPSGDAVRSQTGKPGAYKMEPMTPTGADVATKDLTMAYVDSFTRYQRLIDKGLAKEVARNVLPLGMYSEMIATCNAKSLMHFLALRDADAALLEIREYAKILRGYFASIMPETHKLFSQHGGVGW